MTNQQASYRFLLHDYYMFFGTIMKEKMYTFFVYANH